MSNVAIRRALEARLKTLEPPVETAWENTEFTPKEGVPYQSTNLLFAEPDDAGFANSPYIQRGFLQVTLHYPTNVGPGVVQRRAEALRTFFFRGLSLAADGVMTIIEKTPEITGGAVEEGRYVMRVRVRFYAHIDPSGDMVSPADLPTDQEW